MPAPDPSVIANVSQGISTSGNSITLDAVPTPGNWLVVCSTRNGSIAAHTAGTNWTRHASSVDSTGFVSAAILYYEVQTGDTATVTPWGNGGTADPWVCFELTGVDLSTGIVDAHCLATTNLALANPPSMVSAASPAVFIGLAVGRGQTGNVNPDWTGTPIDGEGGFNNGSSRQCAWVYSLLDQAQAIDLGVTYAGGSGPYADMALLIAADGAVVAVAPATTQVAALAVVDPRAKTAITTQMAAMVVTLPYIPPRVTQAVALGVATIKDADPPRPLVPMMPVTERWSWRTAISRTLVNREQRASLRGDPRVTHLLDLPVEAKADRQELFALLYRYSGGQLRYPAFQHATEVDAAYSVGASEIGFDTVAANAADGSWIAVFTGAWTFLGYAELDTIDADGGTLASPLEFAIPSGSRIMVAPTYRLPDRQSMTMGYPYFGTARIPLEIVDETPFVHDLESAASLDTVDGLYVLPKHFGVDDVTENFDRGVMTVDNDIGVPSDYTQFRGTVISQNRSYHVGLDDLPYWRQFFAAVAGSRKRFLLPSFRDDVDLSEVPPLGSTQLVSDNQSLREALRWAAYSHLRIETRNGVIYRRHNVTADPDTGNALINLTQAIGSDPGDNDISRISLVYLCRLLNDQVEVQMHHHYAILSFDVQTVNE